jgi:hypothetical protein
VASACRSGQIVARTRLSEHWPPLITVHFPPPLSTWHCSVRGTTATVLNDLFTLRARCGGAHSLRWLRSRRSHSASARARRSLLSLKRCCCARCLTGRPIDWSSPPPRCDNATPSIFPSRVRTFDLHRGANFLTLVGGAVVIGRTFTDADGQPLTGKDAGPPEQPYLLRATTVAVLSYDYWQRRY